MTRLPCATRLSRALVSALVVAFVVLAAAAPAWAQPQTVRVRVTADRATIWRPGFLTPAALVNRDDILDVVGRRGNWLEVALPTTDSLSRETGFIAVTQVVVITGTLPASDPLATRPAPTGSQPRRDRPPTTRPRHATGVRAFGDITATSFTAKNTFKAVFKSPAGVFFGGGAEVRVADVFFVQGAIRRYRATGERVFVFGGEVFALGIDDTLTLTPITVTVGGRFPIGHIAPFIGGGVGFEQVQETSQFSEAGDDTNHRIRTYHLAGGIEWKGSGLVGVAAELGYTRALKGLTGGLSDIYGEHDLGGIDVRIRVLLGK